MTPADPIVRRFGAALLALTFVAGCDTISDQLSDTIQGKIELPCPTSSIIADASRRLEFRAGTGRDLTDIDNEISIDNVSVGCKSDVNRKSMAGKMKAWVFVDFTLSRGPANRSRRTDFRYFVSVVNLADKVLYREAFDLAVLFSENETRRSVSADPIELEIPIQSGQTGENFRVLVGMILTREQLNSNRLDRRPRL